MDSTSVIASKTRVRQRLVLFALGFGRLTVLRSAQASSLVVSGKPVLLFLVMVLPLSWKSQH
jgi:hypothetical protein